MSDTTLHTEKSFVSEEKAMEIAEASREKSWDRPSFLRELFLGNFRKELLFPFPEGSNLERPEFVAFFSKMKKFLEEDVDSDAIDREGKIPQHIIDRLREFGAFGMKIEKKYGGLGLSQAEYNRIMQLFGTADGNLGALLSAHQSIGVPQPLKMFGTDRQKQRYLPRIAKGQITAFALTEDGVGSDPANLSTTVEDSADGSFYLLNGRKLWCTNGTVADLLVVMARHKEDDKISAFIVETEWEGVQVEHRCHFMGLRALENGVISFENVRIPKENILWGRGKGLKLALITLNTGRLTLPAATAGLAQNALNISRTWANERVQWGHQIGKHEAIAQKLADMAAKTYALMAVADMTTAMAEQGNDIRLEAAVGKMYNTEAAWKIIDDTLQIRGGRGYETADSLKSRGEEGIPVERIMRDSRINLIFEGSSEIMRLFIAREAVDKHLQIAGEMIDPKKGIGAKLAALPKIAAFYATWYPGRWIGWGFFPQYGEFGILAKHMRFIDRNTRKLSRQIFHGMLVHQAALQRKQAFLFRIVDIGAELFTMAATISKAMKDSGNGRVEALELADQYCRTARKTVKKLFSDLWSNDDSKKYSFAQNVLQGKFAFLEEGIVERGKASNSSNVSDLKRPAVKEGEPFAVVS